jgi:LDH2 family malate/lactate/ureidoglycolate dehydrogenase
LCRTGGEVPDGVSVPYISDPRILLGMLERGDAALTPIGKHKGYGLSVAIEMFCSALSNGDALSQLKGHYEGIEGKAYNLGHFFLAIDPSYFIGIETFKQKVSSIRSELKRSGSSVIVAGDLEFEGIEERMNGVEISNDLYRELREIAIEFNFSLERL